MSEPPDRALGHTPDLTRGNSPVLTPYHTPCYTPDYTPDYTPCRTPGNTPDHNPEHDPDLPLAITKAPETPPVTALDFSLLPHFIPLDHVPSQIYIADHDADDFRRLSIWPHDVRELMLKDQMLRKQHSDMDDLTCSQALVAIFNVRALHGGGEGREEAYHVIRGYTHLELFRLNQPDCLQILWFSKLERPQYFIKLLHLFLSMLVGQFGTWKRERCCLRDVLDRGDTLRVKLEIQGKTIISVFYDAERGQVNETGMRFPAIRSLGLQPDISHFLRLEIVD